jgi:hypothetical protein
MNIEFAKMDINESQKNDIEATRRLFDDLLNVLNLMITEGRYLSVVKTKLEEACFLLTKVFVYVNNWYQAEVY